MQYIIMCGGRYDKWKTPRQLIEVYGEPIVARTIRLLRKFGINKIAISTHDERFDKFGVPLLQHDNSFVSYQSGCWVDAFYPMSTPTCYLMGDVVYSSAAIKTIVETDTNDIMYFASAPPFSEFYIKRWAEPFAFKVVDQQHFRGAIAYVRANVSSGIFWRHPISWELWQVINNEDVQAINYHNYTVINDYTCDIDEPEDVERIEKAIKQWQMYNR